MEKKIRFGDLVRSAGRPQTATLWTQPEDDPAFSRALRQNRVLTIVQQPTTRHKDFGLIGFHPESHAGYLVFPRALPKDQQSHVIGINYQLLDEPEAAPRPKAESKPERPRPVAKPAQKTFTVKVRRTAQLETEVRVQAATRKAAVQEALESIKDQDLDLGAAQVRQEVVGVE